MTPARLWCANGRTVVYTSPDSGRMHVGTVAYAKDQGRRLYVRFDPPIPGVPSPTPVPVACCRPSAEAP